MKAYLVHKREALPPFRKPVSQLRFKEGTLAERLERQLCSARLEVVKLDQLDTSRIDPHSLVVTDDVVLSDSFLKRFLAAIPDRSSSYQVEIEQGRFPLLASRRAPPRWKKLPVFYYGDAPQRGEPRVLQLQPTPVFEFVEGLPARMQALTDICVYFFDIWGIHLAYWFDFQTASSLYCRELVAKLIGPFHGRVPGAILSRVASSPRLMSKANSIGRRTRIHRTAILEGCVIGDGVEIGPYSYLRSSVIADGAVVREKSSIKMSYVGTRAFIMGSDLVNTYIGAETSIFSPMVYNAVFGERGFLSGGSGFADFIVGAESIPATIEGKQVSSGLPFLASCVGDDCFIGANLLFAPGRTIPDGTNLLDHGLIKSVPTKPDGSYVVSGTDLVQIPSNFFRRGA
jgi:acetyltransferase-like isoleucine patch superfamily enzyme